MRDWPPEDEGTLTRPGARYYTSESACSCPDYVYRRMRLGLPCKHIWRLQEAEALIASNRAKWVEREATD